MSQSSRVRRERIGCLLERVVLGPHVHLEAQQHLHARALAGGAHLLDVASERQRRALGCPARGEVGDRLARLVEVEVVLAEGDRRDALALGGLDHRVDVAGHHEVVVVVGVSPGVAPHRAATASAAR